MSDREVCARAFSGTTCLHWQTGTTRLPPCIRARKGLGLSSRSRQLPRVLRGIVGGGFIRLPGALVLAQGVVGNVGDLLQRAAARMGALIVRRRQGWVVRIH